MNKISIENIPAVIWGEPSNSIYIYVHGKLSSKEEASGFSQIAARKGCQVLSFDLPEHGERENEKTPCTVWNGVRDLGIVGKYARENWNDICLYGSSLGAYFSLLAYKDLPLRKCLFLSPVLDMVRLIQNMMKQASISEQDLMEKRDVLTPAGETLNWDYYCYVKENPVDRWDASTAILYGSEDDVTEPEVAEGFTKRWGCDLTVLEGGGHWFHTERELALLDTWLIRHI